MPTTTHGNGPYRTATLTVPRVRPRRAWRLVALAAALAATDGARRTTRHALGAPRVTAQPALHDVGTLRPLEGVDAIVTMITPQGEALAARRHDGSLRRLTLDADAPIGEGLAAQRALAEPFTCTTRGGVSQCIEPPHVPFSNDGGRITVTTSATGRVTVTCREPYGDVPPWTLRGNALAASESAFCLRGDDGRARCFSTMIGDVEDERSYDADCAQVREPSTVTPTPIAGMTVHDAEACAWTTDGALSCADLRHGGPARFQRIGVIAGLDRVWMSSTLGGLCARDGGGRVWCRGPWVEPIVDPTAIVDSPPPGYDAFAAEAPWREVPELVGATSLTWVLNQGGCAVLPRGRVACWGLNHLGQIADGSAYRRVSPARVDLPTGAVSLSAGPHHACAALRDGRVFCWGDNDHGQLGDGTLVPRGTPRTVPLPAPALEVAAGAHHTCARTTAGLWCWGDGAYGALGDGAAHNTRTAVRVATLDDAAELSAGAEHTCARTAAGDVYCWGRFGCGWPGQPRVQGSLRPLRVGLDGAAVALRSIGVFACAELRAGGVRCWGMRSNDRRWPDATNGRCPASAVTFTPRRATLAGVSSWWEGDPRSDDLLPSRVVTEVDEVSAVTEGVRFTCALTRRGDVRCWGDNDTGQLGDGRAPYVATPQLVVEAVTVP